MFLLICVIGMFVSLIVWACGKDWEASERNASIRTDRIVSAIHSSTSELKSCYSRITEQQIDYFDRFHEDMEKENEFCDEHGRWFRRRIIYDPDGKPIAEEVIGIESPLPKKRRRFR